MPEVPETGDYGKVWNQVAAGPLVGSGTEFQADRVIFSHELARLEAEADLGAESNELPWIRVPNPEVKPQSSPVPAKESASRL
jgi:hypothetical protein